MFLEYLKRFPGNAQAWNNLGAVRNESEKLASAKEAFGRALELDPDFADVYYNLSVIAWKKKDFSEVRRLLKLALEKNPNYEAARRLLERTRSQ